MGITSKKVSKTIYITPEQNEALEKLTQKTKVPQSEYIREGIEFALKKYKDIIDVMEESQAKAILKGE